MITFIRSHKLPAAVLSGATTVGLLAALAVLGAFSGSASALELPPVAKKMQAFTAPPIPEGAIPANVRAGLDRLPDPERHGSFVASEVRLLRQGLGANRVGLYAAPTTAGVVCFIVSEQTYVGTCAAEFSQTQGDIVPALYFGEDVPFTVAGLASDDVKRVRVVTESETYVANLGKNAFFWQSDSDAVTRETLLRLLVEQVDGSVIAVDTPRA